MGRESQGFRGSFYWEVMLELRWMQDGLLPWLWINVIIMMLGKSPEG